MSAAVAPGRATGRQQRRLFEALGPEVAERPRRAPEQSPTSAGGGPTLGQRLDRVWERLSAAGAAECPMCGGRLVGAGGAGRCRGCGTEVA